MEQQIGFCTTADGVRIAYATIGEGPPMVYVAGWPGHLSAEWEKRHSRELLEDLAQGVTLIRYDMRGSGLSDRKVDAGELTFEKWILDLEAVVDHLKLERFTLISLGFLAGPLAMQYAATHPERVSQLILSDAYLRGRELTTPERGRAMVDFISLYGFPISFDGDLTPEEIKKFQDVSKIQKQAATVEVQGQVARAMLSVDVSALVDKLTMPVLVMHGDDDQVVPFNLGQDVASSIPHSKFIPFDQPVSAPWVRQEQLTGEIHRFLGIDAAARQRPVQRPAGDVHTILFTDMESSTALTQRLGDAKAQELVREHNEIVRDALREHDGKEVKHTGDGIMASFHSASRALDCAVTIQRAVAECDSSLKVHIGLNAGEPVVEDEDLYGTAVQLARRICDRAQPGQILVSNVVRELSAGKGFLFADSGEVELKGFEDAVRLYEVSWSEQS
ncbi:MAG: adenylate/guanylate cyclase domain-containing protein [Dehalococcoidia bacterium]